MSKRLSLSSACMRMSGQSRRHRDPHRGPHPRYRDRDLGPGTGTGTGPQPPMHRFIMQRSLSSLSSLGATPDPDQAITTHPDPDPDPATASEMDVGPKRNVLAAHLEKTIGFEFSSEKLIEGALGAASASSIKQFHLSTLNRIYDKLGWQSPSPQPSSSFSTTPDPGSHSYTSTANEGVDSEPMTDLHWRAPTPAELKGGAEGQGSRPVRSSSTMPHEVENHIHNLALRDGQNEIQKCLDRYERTQIREIPVIVVRELYKSLRRQHKGLLPLCRAQKKAELAAHLEKTFGFEFSSKKLIEGANARRIKKLRLSTLNSFYEKQGYQRPSPQPSSSPNFSSSATQRSVSGNGHMSSFQTMKVVNAFRDSMQRRNKYFTTTSFTGTSHDSIEHGNNRSLFSSSVHIELNTFSDLLELKSYLSTIPKLVVMDILERAIEQHR